MEDARQEFKFFLSSSRANILTAKEFSRTKQREVPVINKLPNSIVSTFTISQRKCSVYKAVSGVSFQETEVSSKPPKIYNERKESGKVRRKSYATSNADSNSSVRSEISGTRRSRSLTNVRNLQEISSNTSRQTTEIIHPFVPVILHGERNTRSRYIRYKDKRRSASQARQKSECYRNEKGDLVSQNLSQPIIPPRRSRSASRPRHSLSLVPFEDDELIKRSPSINKENEVSMKYESRYAKNSNAKIPPLYNHHRKMNNYNKIRHWKQSAEDLNFKVTESDWRKLDELVTEKLDSLLKKKEEPEGGYFSLEREELDTVPETLTQDAESFERENSSETIYIAQGIRTKEKDIAIPKNDQYSLEEIYSEVPFTSNSTEVGYVDDEGLYEEIFFDQNEYSSQKTHSLNGQDMVSSSINIQILPTTYSSNFHKESSELNDESKFNSHHPTVVQIVGNDSYGIHNKPNPSQSLDLSRSSGTCLNNEIKNKNVFYVDRWRDDSNSVGLTSFNTQDYDNSSKLDSCPSFPSKYSSGFQERYQDSSDLLTSRQTFFKKSLSPFHFCEDNKMAGYKKIYLNENVPRNNPERLGRNINCNNRDYELSDIDLEMFAPKKFNNKSCNKMKIIGGDILHHGPSCAVRESQRNHRQSCVTTQISPFIIDNPEYNSPKTLNSILQDCLFNPAIDNEFINEASEDLVIAKDQVITCISDTSSSSDENGNENGGFSTCSVSPWLEAKDEFEYVGFNAATNGIHETSIKKSDTTSSKTINLSSNLIQNRKAYIFNGKSKEEERTPRRPSRRRRRKTTAGVGHHSRNERE